MGSDAIGQLLQAFAVTALVWGFVAVMAVIIFKQNVSIALPPWISPAVQSLQLRGQTYIARFQKWWQKPGSHLTFTLRAAGAIALGIGIYGHFFVEDNNWSAELIGISVTVLGIDEINRRRTAIEFKQSIKRQLASRSNDFALDAARIIVDNEWHKGGFLKGAYLYGANLEGAHLVSANLEGAHLMSANLEGASLLWANLEGADLMNANLEGASLVSANLEGAHLEIANLEGAYLSGANLEGANLEIANLEGADLMDANLEGADLMSVNLEGADLMNANLEGADLMSANLEGAYLSGANLEGADLMSANLKGSVYNKNTTWPENYTPSESSINWDEASEEDKERWRQEYRPASGS